MDTRATHAVPKNHVTGANLGHAHHGPVQLEVGMSVSVRLRASETSFFREDSREVGVRDVCGVTYMRFVKRGKVQQLNLPYFQLLASDKSAVSDTGLKKGRKMRYAFESKTLGKTWRVPPQGVISLSASQPW